MWLLGHSEGEGHIVLNYSAEDQNKMQTTQCIYMFLQAKCHQVRLTDPTNQNFSFNMYIASMVTVLVSKQVLLWELHTNSCW